MHQQPTPSPNEPDAPTTRPGLAVLDEHRCRQLLADAHVGRLGFTYRALPVVLPVNIVLVGGEVVFQTDSNSILSAAAAGDVACIEVDDHDVFDHVGWSVLATGRLREITDPARVAEVQRLPVPVWRPMTQPHHVALGIELLSGRHIAPTFDAMDT